ncbi:MAG: tetratricopeptide repeat protein [Hydrococcus sp. SU_1_0]|nr:tetratricopeptide repeat protein [Hydrococcus sp. SU_1_0]
MTYCSLQKYQKAIDDYDVALTAQSQSPVIYNNRGIAYQQLQQYQRAIGDYTQAILFDSNYGAAYYNRALVYQLLENPQKSLKDLTTAHNLFLKQKKVSLAQRTLAMTQQLDRELARRV